MIRSFRSKALAELWQAGRTAKLDARMTERIKRRLAALDAATKPEDMDRPGFEFHTLHGRPVRYTVHINGPWCITWEWESGNAIRVDFENYH